MPRLYSEIAWPLHIRQMEADAAHSPRPTDAERIAEAKDEFFAEFDPVTWDEYQRGE